MATAEATPEVAANMELVQVDGHTMVVPKGFRFPEGTKLDSYLGLTVFLDVPASTVVLAFDGDLLPSAGYTIDADVSGMISWEGQRPEPDQRPVLHPLPGRDAALRRAGHEGRGEVPLRRSRSGHRARLLHRAARARAVGARVTQTTDGATTTLTIFDSENWKGVLTISDSGSTCVFTAP